MNPIRLFTGTEAEYQAIAEIQSIVCPEEKWTVAHFKHVDATRNRDYFYQRLLYVVEEKIVATTRCREPYWSYRPGKYQFVINVHPNWEGQGIGTSLYEWIWNALAAREPKPTLLTTYTREDKPRAVRFLLDRGFEQVMRWPRSELDVTSFQPTDATSQAAAQVEQSGIRIVSISELQSSDAEWQRKIYDLDWECTQDEPQPDLATQISLEEYVQREFGKPDFLPDGWFVALDGDRYVGLSILYRNPGDTNVLDTGFTGVARAYRRRSIATTLKLSATQFAQEYGATTIRTDNEENNPMYQINLQLGFRPLPADLAFEKKVA